MAPRPNRTSTRMKRAAERLSYDAATASISRTHSQCQREGRTPHVRAGEPARRSGLHTWRSGGASRDRTGDLKLAKLALSQLSYGPAVARLRRAMAGKPAVLTRGWLASRSCEQRRMVGRVGVEPTTSRLSGVRSNHLSYRPESPALMRDPKERETKTAVSRQNGM